MAYNPFNIFRRNQKALFAVLTVFIMIMFTLQSGVVGGDAFEWFSRWLGGRGGKGDVVCKIDGDKVRDSELRDVRRNRVMANRFMALAGGQTVRTIEAYMSTQQARLGEEGQRLVSQASMTARLLQSREYAATIIQELPAMADSLNRVIDSPTAKSEDKDVARAVQAMYQLLYHQSLGSDHYFLNAPNRSQRDTIEFILWEKKADQLGIRFTIDDVKILINREFYGYFKSDVEVRKAMQESESFNMDTCLKAIATEFKVRAAQTAVLGRSGRGAPVFSTPFELFEYYQLQCSPATYELIAVPSLAFIDKVPSEPTESELNELFKKYEQDEPNPSKEGFGFKEPRKLAISWLAVTGEEPYYTKLATEQVRIGEVMAKASGMTTVPLPGVGGGWAMAAAAPLAIKEPAVDAAYASYEYGFSTQKKFNYQSSTLSRLPFATLPTDDPILPTSVVRPGTMAATLGGVVGQSAPFGHPAVAASLAMGAPMAYEVRDRIKVGLPLVLGVLPNPAMIPTIVSGTAASSASEPKPLPIEALRPELLKTRIATLAKSLAKEDLTRLTERVNQLSPTNRWLGFQTSKDGLPGMDTGKEREEFVAATAYAIAASAIGRPARETYIKDFMAARGLTNQGVQFGSSTTGPRDEWTLEEDPGLRPLVEAHKDAIALAKGTQGGRGYTPFGRSFFAVDPRAPAPALYTPKPYPPQDRGGAKTQYVYWVTEEIAAKRTNLVTARETVKAAWKQIKARELAQARANAIAEAIRKDPTTDSVLLPKLVNDEAWKFQQEITNPKARRRAGNFPLKDVSPLVTVDPREMNQQQITQLLQQGQSITGRLQPFTLSESENIPYPTRDMMNTLLDNRDKPAKTVLVLHDTPKDTYYVATLIKRELKTPEEFKQNVYAPRGPARDVITGLHLNEAARKSRQSVVDLLKKEFRYEETEDQKKKLDENVKSGGRD